MIFEWLHRNDEHLVNSPDALGTIDKSERIVLCDLSACLDRVLAQPFDPDYAALLAKARAEVRGPTD